MNRMCPTAVSNFKHRQAGPKKARWAIVVDPSSIKYDPRPVSPQVRNKGTEPTYYKEIGYGRLDLRKVLG